MAKEPKDFRLHMCLPRSLLGRIDDWRYAKRLPTRAKAIRELVDRQLGGASGEKSMWQPIETAPKDGQIVWAWLYQTGIRAVRWGTAEEWAERLGGSPDEYQDCWVEADDDSEEWSPKWWLPYDAIPAPAEPR